MLKPQRLASPVSKSRLASMLCRAERLLQRFHLLLGSVQSLLQETVAADGEQGIALQRKQPASLLITDIFIPNKEGIETIRDFRAEFPGVPIIAMSGGGRLKRRGSGLLTAKALGAAVILRKPFEMSDLLRSVAAALNPLEP